jgi:hypothetical protein
MLRLTEGLNGSEERDKLVGDEGRAAETAALAGRAAAGVFRASDLHGSARGVPTEEPWGSRGFGDYRRRGIVRAEHLTGGGFGFNSGTSRARGRGRSFGKLPGGEAELLRALAGAEMHWSNGSTAEQEVRCGGAGGRGARGSTAPGGLGLRFPGVRVPLFVGRRNGLGVRARRGARRDSRAAGVRGRRKRKWGRRR